MILNWLRWPQHSSQRDRRNLSRSRSVASQRTPSSSQWGCSREQPEMWAVFRDVRRWSFLRTSREGLRPVQASMQRIRCRPMWLPGTFSWHTLQVPGIAVLTGIISQSQLQLNEGQFPYLKVLDSLPPSARTNSVESISKLKPKWDVHLPGAGKQAWNLERVLRPLIAG